ncbi:MAG: hypothetical protein KIS94_13960 [Chitinophagales bacterium]|nr:hypothetical protein [Chitinophagales bacterium]
MKFPVSVFLSLAIVLSLTYCVKDKTIVIVNPPPIGCTQTDSFLLPVHDTVYSIPFPWQAPLGWQVMVNRRYQYFTPCFNPNNPNEMVYVRQDRTVSLTTCELRIFDLCTGEDRLLYPFGYLGAHPQWSKTGWIVFKAAVGSLWKIRSSGQGLVQLTYGNDQLAVWSPDGSKILFKRFGFNIILCDSNGVILDTLTQLLGGGNWSWGIPDKLTIATNNSPTGYGVGYFDFNLNEYVLVKALDLNNNNCLLLRSTLWFNQNRDIIYSFICGIEATNVSAGQTTTIKRWR